MMRHHFLWKDDVALPARMWGKATMSGFEILGDHAPCLSVRVTLATDGAEPLHLVNGTGKLVLSGAKAESTYGPSVVLYGSMAPTDRRDVGNGRAISFDMVFRLDCETFRRVDEFVGPVHGLGMLLECQLSLLGAGAATVGLVCNHQLRPDDWRDLVAKLGYGLRRAFEVRADSFLNLEDFEGSYNALQTAQEHIRCGRYEQAVGEARRVIEAALKDRGYVNAHGRWDYEGAKAAGLPEEIAAFLRACKDVTNPPHHVDHYKWARADAEFTLNLAAALAQYVGLLVNRT